MDERLSTTIPLRTGHDLIVTTREDGLPRYHIDVVCNVNGARQIELSRGADWDSTVARALDVLSAIQSAINEAIPPVVKDLSDSTTNQDSGR